MHKTYRVKLLLEERTYLEQLLGKGTAAARTLTHARILLKADEGALHLGWQAAGAPGPRPPAAPRRLRRLSRCSPANCGVTH